MSAWEYDWMAVRADEVVEGDLYANGATVTESRPYDHAEDYAARSDMEWTIRCGEGFATFGTRDRRVVVGRNARYTR